MGATCVAIKKYVESDVFEPAYPRFFPLGMYALFLVPHDVLSRAQPPPRGEDLNEELASFPVEHDSSSIHPDSRPLRAWVSVTSLEHSLKSFLDLSAKLLRPVAEAKDPTVAEHIEFLVSESAKASSSQSPEDAICAGQFIANQSIAIPLTPASSHASHGSKSAVNNSDSKPDKFLIYNPTGCSDASYDWLLGGDGTKGKGNTNKKDQDVNRSENSASVDFIVSPSGAHTLFVSKAAKRWPSARIIASHTAARKLSSLGVKPSYTYTLESDLTTLKKHLEPYGIEPILWKGDPNAALWLLHHPTRTLLECDTTYGGPMFASMDISDRTPECIRAFIEKVDNRIWKGRQAIFASTSPNGMLPVYRMAMFDPRCPLIQLVAPEDRTTPVKRRQMRECLEELLAREDYDTVISAHGFSFSRAEYVRDMHQQWSWL